MSNSPNYAPSSFRNDNQSNSINYTASFKKSCFGNVLNSFRRIFHRRPQINENSRLSVQAVDSVRLVYMRRILHNSMSENTYSGPILSQQSTQVDVESSVTSASMEQETPHQRRRRSNRPTLEALELALRTYESKHRELLQHTAQPNEKYLSVESVNSAYYKKGLNKFHKRKTDVSSEDNSGVMKIEGDKRKTLYSVGVGTDDEEEEKNVCFDVESGSLGSFREEGNETNQNKLQEDRMS